VCQVAHICRCVSRSAWYIKVEYKDGASSVYLVASKTKVTPLQSITIPCLELMGAALGNRLAKSVAKCLFYGNNIYDLLDYITYGG